MKYKKIIELFVCVISACAMTGCGKDYPEYLTKNEWEFRDFSCTRNLSFGKDGSFSYSESCGNAVGNFDLYEKYDFDKEKGVITIKSNDKECDDVRWKVIKHSDSSLLLKTDEGIKEFLYKIELPEPSYEVVEHFEGYSAYRKFTDKKGNKIKVGLASFDADENSLDELWEEVLAKDFEYAYAEVKIIQCKGVEVRDVTYKELGKKGFLEDMEDDWVEGYVWYNDKMEIEKIVSYGDLVIQDDTTKKIKVPASCLGDITQKDLDIEVEEGLYISAKLNKDGSVTYEMCDAQQENILEDKKQLFEDYLDEMTGEDDYGIKSIEKKKDFSEFKVILIDNKIPEAEKIITEKLMDMGILYQALQGKKSPKMSIKYICESNGEVLLKKSIQE